MLPVAVPVLPGPVIQRMGRRPIFRADAAATIEMVAAEMAVGVADISVLPVEIVKIAIPAPIAAAIRPVIAVIIERDITAAMRPAVIAIVGRAAAEQEKSRSGADQGFCLGHNVPPRNTAPPVLTL